MQGTDISVLVDSLLLKAFRMLVKIVANGFMPSRVMAARHILPQSR